MFDWSLSLFYPQQMHDEVSETENIRKNLAIERIIIGGCDVLLDVNQVFIRQGSVLHLPVPKVIKRINSFKGDKEVVRQCFLFSNHILLCIRASNGKLNVVEVKKILRILLLLRKRKTFSNLP